MLIYLSINTAKLCSIDEIATNYKVSKNHLTKVASTLVKSGIVKAVRGKGGGLCLAAKPEEIRIGTIVRITEPDFALVECFSKRNGCVITSVCKLKAMLNQATTNFLQELDKYNLAELLLNKEEILPLFNN